MHGPDGNHITALVELEEDRWDLIVVNKYSGELAFHNEYVIPGTVVAGGGYIIVADSSSHKRG